MGWRAIAHSGSAGARPLARRATHLGNGAGHHPFVVIDHSHPVAAGNRRQPGTQPPAGHQSLNRLGDFTGLGWFDIDLDRPATSQTHLEGVLVGDPIGHQTRFARREHLESVEGHIALDATAAHGTVKLFRRGHQETRPFRPGGRPLHPYHSRQGNVLALPLPLLEPFELFGHAPTLSDLPPSVRT